MDSLNSRCFGPVVGNLSLLRRGPYQTTYPHDQCEYTFKTRDCQNIVRLDQCIEVLLTRGHMRLETKLWTQAASQDRKLFQESKKYSVHAG